jgi:hypothetical protein
MRGLINGGPPSDIVQTELSLYNEKHKKELIRFKRINILTIIFLNRIY